MKLTEVKSILNARVISGEEYLEREVSSACGSDLMSDVLAFVKDQGMLLTGLVNVQVVRTAEMMDMNAIVFVRGKNPGDDIIELAKRNGIVILSTDHPLYIACGRLYHHGLSRKEDSDE